jgi:acyl-CoA-binding protein
MAEYRPVEELYDLQADTHEVNNLAEDPDYHATLADFRSRLDGWISETDDKGQMPENPEVALFWDRFMWDRWEEWMETKGFSPEVDNQEYLRWWEVRLRQMKNLT